MFNFIWLDIDSSWQTSDSKWLDRFCDSTLTRLDQVMTQTVKIFRWLWLDKNDLNTSLKFRGAISVIFGSQVSVGSQVFFRIVKNHGEKSYFRRF